MNSSLSTTLQFLTTRKFPGIPLANIKNSISGTLLPALPNQALYERIIDFGSKTAEPENYFSFVTCIVDSLGKQEISALKKYFPNLRHIGNFGVGFNHIDVSFATENALRITNSPGVLAEATADIALTLILCVSRRIAEGYSIVKNTLKYPGWSPDYLLGTSISQKNLGIVGLGQIGKALARRAQACGMNCYALQSNKATSLSFDENSSIPRLPEEEFFAKIDILSLNCPLTEQTKNWLNKDRISKIKRGGIVINTARGELIDEEALATALNNNHLFGAGLDVFCHEPVLSEHLKTAKNLFILPHLGSATLETRAAMGQIVYDSICALNQERLGLRQKGALPYQIN